MNPLDAKIARLNSGGRPRVLDLFAGCGGMSLGFHRAGCTSTGGIEVDPDAARSYGFNFHRDDRHHEQHARARDITEGEPEAVVASFGHLRPAEVVDVIVGGPPCPTFTRVGRAKLREVHQHPDAFLHDPRSQLFTYYLDYVRALRPLAVVMENVPDFLNWGGHNLAEEIADALEAEGFKCSYTLLNAASYGVPQMRERFVLVAVQDRVGAAFQFPLATHLVDFPPGYEGTRDVALKAVRGPNMFGGRNRHVPTPGHVENPLPPVTVADAIRDLPPVTSHLEGTLRRGARRFDERVGWRPDVEPSSYARDMRSWPGFESDGGLFDHAIRSLGERDFRLFKGMRHGDDYPKAFALAERLFGEECRRRGLAARSAEAQALRPAFVPPYDPGKFPNKWRKMEPDLPARTLMAHLGKDTYSHIHYDGAQARTISVREAARLQSFPDGFKFCGTMNPAFRQIGNAVPPLLAFSVARPLVNLLCKDARPAVEGPTGRRPPGDVPQAV